MIAALMTCMLAVTVQATALPGPEVPVGYARTSLDTGVPDALSEPEGDTRVLAVELWYPATDAGPPKAWASPAMGEALSGQFPFPEDFEQQVTANASIEADIEPGAHPVIVLSHGLSFPITLYQSFAERLAAEGYVVVGVNHPHAASFIEYEDGRTLDMSAWPSFEEEDDRQRHLAEHAGVWEADLKSVLDALGEWNGEGGHLLAGHLDLDRIGVAGHSYGGTAAARLSLDPRVDAVVALEGAVRDPSDEAYRGALRVGAPMLHVIGGYNRYEMEIRDYVPAPGAPVYRAIINGTGHAQLSDLIYVYAEFADEAWHERNRYGLAPGRVLQITHDYMTAFFDLYLRGENETPLLRPGGLAARHSRPQEAGYPEVDLTIDVAARLP